VLNNKVAMNSMRHFKLAWICAFGMMSTPIVSNVRDDRKAQDKSIPTMIKAPLQSRINELSKSV
jgi:hypothetical protein